MADKTKTRKSVTLYPKDLTSAHRHIKALVRVCHDARKREEQLMKVLRVYCDKWFNDEGELARRVLERLKKK